MEHVSTALEDISGLITNYAPSADTVALIAQTQITLLVGISGAGKDTIKHKLLDTGAYHHIVSHTTRSPRENKGVMEQDGLEYNFVSLDTARIMLERGEIIEANIYSGNVYGTSVSEIKRALQNDQIAIADIDVNGAANFKRISSQVVAMFILPPNFTEWQRRLHARYGEKGSDPADIDKRMHTAIVELEHALEVPYYHFIVNDDLDRAVHAANSIAHNHDTFNEIDVDARHKAERLLADIRNHMGV